MQSKSNSKYFLTSASDSNLEELLRWRNQPNVRASMVNTKKIVWDDHLEWWKNFKEDRSKKLFLVKSKNKTVAVINFFNLHKKNSGWWGFYLTDMVENKNVLETWMAVEGIAIRYAFEALLLLELYCETRSSNEAVLALHDRHCFETVDTKDFPNAIKNKLIVKRLTRSLYEKRAKNCIAKSAIDVPLNVKVSPTVYSLAFIGSANWDEIALNLPTSFYDYSKIELRVHRPAFGQALMDLFDKASKISNTNCDYLVFCERVEDFLHPFSTPSDLNSETFIELAREYMSRITELRGLHRAYFIIHDFKLIKSQYRSISEQTAESNSLNKAIILMNGELKKLCDNLSDCTLLPVANLLDEIGHENADPGKYWLMGRFPYGPKFSSAYHRLISGTLMALLGATTRAVVLDLDNTCWGGVIGDDGVHNIKLGTDYPGNQFLSFQKFIKSISDLGIIIAVCSKNNESVALSAFRENPEMVLQEEDIITHRINWLPKSKNIEEIAAELDLGLKSLMFIDDNPMERLEVQQNLSEVVTPDMPPDVADWPRYLKSHPALCSLTFSTEDKQKSKNYKIRKEIKAVERSSTDKDSFLAKLEMKIEISSYNEASKARTLQLFAKTNQFNTTTKRYSELQLQEIINSGGEVLTVRIEDKFGSNEIIAAAVVKYTGKQAIIENYVMSCRVMGRGIETAVLGEICARASGRGFKDIAGIIIETDRNEPCRDLYSGNGFEHADQNTYTLSLRTPVQFPDWFVYI